MSEQKTTTRVQVTVEVIDHQPWAPDCVVGTILGREPLGVGRRVPEAAMTLADYLASEAAREDVRKTIDKWPLHPLGNEWRWTIESEGQWVRLSVWSMWADGYPKGAEASAYYRPDGERHTVTDMGEGVRALPDGSLLFAPKGQQSVEVTIQHAMPYSEPVPMSAHMAESAAILRRAEQRTLHA